MAFSSLYSQQLPNSSEPNSSNSTVSTITTDESYEFNWSASLIPRPLSYTTETIKKQLPVTEYNFSEHREEQCAVCLNVMEAKQLTRKLQNCSHVFHVECIDAWIDNNNVTCPLCRADLLYQNEGVESTETK